MAGGGNFPCLSMSRLPGIPTFQFVLKRNRMLKKAREDLALLREFVNRTKKKVFTTRMFADFYQLNIKRCNELLNELCDYKLLFFNKFKSRNVEVAIWKVNYDE
jgi:hypothetical protein